MSNTLLRCRVAYPHVHHPRKNKLQPDAPPKYEVTLVIPPDDPQWQSIREQEIALLQANFPGKTPKNPLIRQRDWSQGMLTMTARTQFKPPVLDASGQPILDPALPADGDYCSVFVSLYTYDAAGNFGVGANLDALKWNGQGPGQLGKGAGLTDDAAAAKFAEEEAKSARQGVQQQQATPPPPQF